MHNIAEGNDLEVKLTRAKLEELCLDLFKRIINPIEKALEAAKTNKTKIDDIVMVGGSSKIPIV